MDHKQVLGRLRYDHPQECLVLFRVETTFQALREQPPREILNSPKHFVAFALATGGHLRALPSSGPHVAQRAPLRKAGFICKQDQGPTTLGRPENRWPRGLQPSEALPCVKRV